MPYVIAGPCLDVRDMSCVEECPVDCIYEGDRKLYIQPVECIDCGACEPVCPVEAIHADRSLPEEEADHKEDNRRFFYDPLPGREAALGVVGGARRVGRMGTDTEWVAHLPPNDEA
jgi:NAD-dependent dihydropyrimidine dehydrogenase PreA subunit